MSNKKIVAVVGVVVLLLVGGGVAWLKAAPAAVATHAVGATGATPSYIVVKTPTPVLFTARIDDPTVIATGVNLLKTDASGKTPKVIGVLKDDGANGDAVKGDKIFTLRVTVNEPVVGSTYYRVSVPFKGVLQRVLTPLLQVIVDPFKLPPDPGEAGKATLEGIDSDKDGVRDDVQRYIALSNPTDAATRSALQQLAVSNQRFLLAADGDVSMILDIAKEQSRANGCLGYLSGFSGRALSATLRAFVLNTKERSLAYAEADGRLSGYSFPILDFSPSNCDS